jgi:hypothetical protein
MPSTPKYSKFFSALEIFRIKFVCIPYLTYVQIGGCPGSTHGQAMWKLWWKKKWHWSIFLSNTSISPANSHSIHYSTFINHPIIDAV